MEDEERILGRPMIVKTIKILDPILSLRSC